MLCITCPTCQTRNTVGRFECSVCFVAIAHIDPTEDDEPQSIEDTSNVTVPVPKPESQNNQSINSSPSLVDDSRVAPDPTLRRSTSLNITCSQCDQIQLPDATGLCMRCGAGLRAPSDSAAGDVPCGEAQWVLIWPWGEETVIDRPLPLGRDTSPLWLRQRLEQHHFDNLSRQHALLTPMPDKLTLMDLGSSNGSFVDNKRVLPHKPIDITASNELRFAAALKISLLRRSPG